MVGILSFVTLSTHGRLKADMSKVESYMFMKDKYTSVCVIGCTFNCLSLWGTAAHLLCYLNVLLGYHLGK